MIGRAQLGFQTEQVPTNNASEIAIDAKPNRKSAAVGLRLGSESGLALGLGLVLGLGLGETEPKARRGRAARVEAQSDGRASASH